MATLTRVLIGVLALTGTAALAVGVWLYAGGISARAAPGRVETAVARQLRQVAIPGAARRLQNPAAETAETLRSGLEHFADHCAVCHDNDGSGQTEMGRGLYPRPPDLRAQATQSLSNGELFYIIEHGVRFTGMPAWSTGTREGEEASWHLVQFIRHLPKITAAELEQMKALNPKSAAEWKEEEEIRRFLSGEGDRAPAPRRHEHGGEER
jgi:mono/diheme cytochrome c family protein